MQRSKQVLWLVLAVGGGAVIIIDRILKALALAGTVGRWPADTGWLEFGIFRNDKFIGWLALPNWLIVSGSVIVLSLVAGLFIWSVVVRRLEFSVGTGLIILGAVSNLADRAAYGWGIDYFGPGWGWAGV